MPEILDWQRVPDPVAVVRRAVDALRAGRLVAFPTETGYSVAASGLVPEAVEKLSIGPAAEPPLLAVGGAAEARDWVPGMSPLGQRLARRLWPGPLTLLFEEGIDRGLAGRLPEPVLLRVCPEGALRLRTPAHETVLEVICHLAGPLVLAAVPGDGAAEAASVEQVVAAAGDRVDLVINDGPGPFRQAPTLVKVNGSAWTVLREGPVSAEMLARQSACLIVFVCTGNTCRSPLAEVLCKKRLAERLGCAVEELAGRGFLVLSAGLAAMMGGLAAPEAVEVACGYGADLSGHRSQPLTPELASRADYLVAMTRGHLQALADQFPRPSAWPRLLSPQGEDLPDPIGCDQQVYQECGRQIWSHLEGLVGELAS
jgi:protein-tyrosine phosphatase